MSFPDKTAIAEVASYLHDASDHVWLACAAADALRFGGPSAVEQLIIFLQKRRISRKSEFRPAGRAALSLAQMGDERGAEAINKTITMLEGVQRHPDQKGVIEAFRKTLKQAQSIIQKASPDKRRSQ
jgi:hypothetical protein